MQQVQQQHRRLVRLRLAAPVFGESIDPAAEQTPGFDLFEPQFLADRPQRCGQFAVRLG